MAAMPGWQQIATQKAQKYGLDPSIFVRQIHQESGGNPAARSPAGAIGIAQIIPSTAKGWGVNPSDPVASLDAAAKNMAAYVRKYGSYQAALSAYNSGRPDGYKSIPETAHYVKTILGGKTPPSAAASSPSPQPTARAAGVADSSLRQQAVLQYLQSNSRNPLDLALGYRQLQAQQPAQPAYRAPTPSPSGGSSQGGVTQFDGKPVASWIKPLLEYARARGWKGSVTSGYRSDAEQTRIYRSGVRPAAKPVSLGGGGSNHSQTAFGHGAVDVSDAQTLNKILKAKGSRLTWAGQRDPVHFSAGSSPGTY